MFWLSGVILWNIVGFLFEFKNMGAIVHVWLCSVAFFIINFIVLLIFILTNDGNDLSLDIIQKKPTNLKID